MEFIDLKTQYRRYQGEIDRRMKQVLEHGHFIMGPEIAAMEKILAEYTGMRHCLTVASGTDSLEIALRALGIGPGDEVITVPFTWISTAEVISLVGAKTVFVDIEPATYNLNPALLERAISPRTKAIIPVSLFGQMADCEAINRIAGARGIPVIEDAAQSFGARRNGRRSCGVTAIASTSFFPAKPFGCYGDGGALFTSDDALADRMRAIRSHGGLKRHHHPFVGMNGRFDTLQAAVLLAKWPHFEWEVAERGRIGARYSEKLRDVCVVPEISPATPTCMRNTPFACRSAIWSANGSRPGAFPRRCIIPMPARTAGVRFPRTQIGDFPESERASREVISLPMHPFLSDADQDLVVDALKSALA